MYVTREQLEKENDYHDFYKLPSDRQEKLLKWIRENLIKDVKLNPRHTSYSIKTFVDLGPGESSWFSNGEFKGAMLEAGFMYKAIDCVDWIFNVHEKSLDWYDPHRHSV